MKLDPSLREHKAALETAIRQILESRPDTKLTKKFKQELFRDLQKRFVLSESSEEISSPLFLMAHKWLFGVGGAVLGALLVVFVQLSQQTPLLPDSPAVSDQGVALEAGESTVTATGRQAFGSLAVTQNTANPVPSPASSEMKMRPQSGGGGGDAMIYPPFNSVNVDFIYDGDITLPQGDVAVLRRVKGGTLPSNISSLVGGVTSKLMDWGSFSGLKARTVNLVESGNEPFNIYLDYSEGTVSMYKEYNWAARPDANCQDEACYARYRLKESDMPSDEAVIGLADAFLAAHGIDTSKYGSPVIEDQWRLWFARAEDKSTYYFPESMNVTYPFLINGKPVYEEYGFPVGLSVTVDIRHDEVSGLNNLQTLDLQSSDYAAVTDLAKFKEFVKRGGINIWKDPNAQKVVSGSLAAPIEGYVRIWKWDETKGTNTELYVPALVFEVSSLPADAMQDRKRVVIPLADELLTQNNGGIMPLMLEDGGPAVDVPATDAVFPEPTTVPGPGTDGIEE